MVTSVDPENLVNSQDVLRLYAEGKTSKLSAYVPKILSRTSFRRMIVLDVISDPHYMSYMTQDQALIGKKQEYWRDVLGVSNVKYADILPRNTVVAVFAQTDLPPMFVFPFFPSHLSLPCKPGESIWAFIEDPTIPNIDIAYWLCRINEPHFIDDVNHTHAPRILDPSFNINSISLQSRAGNDGMNSPIHELRNGPVRIVREQRVTSLNSRFIALSDTPEDIFERLLLLSDGSRLSSYEAVPRFRKRPGDVVLEGSNNSLIVLGTDRNSALSENIDTDFGPTQEWPLTDFKKDAGSIDIVVGRGQSFETSGSEVVTESIEKGTAGYGPLLGRPIKTELAKDPSMVMSTEGDPDLRNDSSRIKISQRTSTDRNFKISKFNSDNFGIEDSEDGDASIAIKTDKIRLIARSDIELIVTDYNLRPNEYGSLTKDEKREPENYSAIVIKANGDIIIMPSSRGIIKLGSDKADRALLCTDLPATIEETSTSKNVSALTSPLLNSMGGSIGGTGIPQQGTWASKVLVVGADHPNSSPSNTA